MLQSAPSFLYAKSDCSPTSKVFDSPSVTCLVPTTTLGISIPPAEISPSLRQQALTRISGKPSWLVAPEMPVYEGAAKRKLPAVTKCSISLDGQNQNDGATPF